MLAYLLWFLALASVHFDQESHASSFAGGACVVKYIGACHIEV